MSLCAIRKKPVLSPGLRSPGLPVSPGGTIVEMMPVVRLLVSGVNTSGRPALSV